jgi:hypothetical protein
MRKTIQGVLYDTERDEELLDECILLSDEDKSSPRSLQRTKSGHYYLKGTIMQVYVSGNWRTMEHGEDLWDYGFSLDDLPSPFVRNLESIAPVTQREAYRLACLNCLPEEFSTLAMAGVPGLGA